MGYFSSGHSPGHTRANVFFLWAGAVGLSGAVFLVGLRLYLVHLTIQALWEDNRKQYLKMLLVGMCTGISGGNQAGQGSLEEDLTEFGLEPFVRENLPTFTVTAGSAWLESKEKGECPVCLLAFKEGEKGRILPQCSHYFHVECIDMWFFSHSTCPLCRSEVGRPREALLDVLGECVGPDTGSQLISLRSLCVPDEMVPSDESPSCGKAALPQHNLDIEPRENFNDKTGENVNREVGKNLHQDFSDRNVVIQLGETVDLGPGQNVSLQLGQNGNDSQTSETESNH